MPSLFTCKDKPWTRRILQSSRSSSRLKKHCRLSPLGGQDHDSRAIFELASGAGPGNERALEISKRYDTHFPPRSLVSPCLSFLLLFHVFAAWQKHPRIGRRSAANCQRAPYEINGFIMFSDMIVEFDAVVVGGGPVGLWVACELALAQLKVAVLERRTERVTQSRALTVHGRTLEVFALRGIVDRFLSLGRPVPNFHFGALARG